MKSKIIKKLITDENKVFKKGDDVCFNLNRNKKEYQCFGVISDIMDNSFVIKKVQIDGMDIVGKLTIKYSEVKDGVLHLTDNGAW